MNKRLSALSVSKRAILKFSRPRASFFCRWSVGPSWAGQRARARRPVRWRRNKRYIVHCRAWPPGRCFMVKREELPHRPGLQDSLVSRGVHKPTLPKRKPSGRLDDHVLHAMQERLHWLGRGTIGISTMFIFCLSGRDRFRFLRLLLLRFATRRFATSLVT